MAPFLARRGTFLFEAWHLFRCFVFLGWEAVAERGRIGLLVVLRGSGCDRFGNTEEESPGSAEQDGR